MKKSIFSFILVVCCFCGGCGLFGAQTYSCNVANVASIQIIVLTNNPEEPGEMYEYSIIRNVSNISEFVGAVNRMDYSINWGDPKRMQIGYTVIKINYFNGDYDLLHYRAQKFYKNDHFQTGYFLFNEHQFEELINSTEDG